MMAPPISEDMCRHMLVWYHEQQKTAPQIALLAGCSLRAVYYILSYDRNYGTINNPFAQTVGRTQGLNTGDLNYLISLLEARPKIYLDELQEELFTA